MSANITVNKKISIWLFACSFLVFAMVVVGGLTRLTESGLSIVKWKPIHGTIPPMSAAEWEEEFNEYKATPEYIKKNYNITTEEFKKIYWWEYAHRLLGRALGIVFFVPFIIFSLKRCFSAKESLELAGIFALGGLQGFVGWWMVSSGLINNPAVSHYRLATHLLIALLIFSLLLWKAFKYYGVQKVEVSSKTRKLVNVLIFAILVQITFGAFIAGLDGGLTYNTWPFMDGKLIPAGIKLSLNNIEFLQFFHRWWAFVVIGLVIVFSRFSKKEKLLRKESKILHAVIGSQIIVGIATLVMVVPVPLASLHQILAVALLAAVVYVRARI